MNRLTQNLRDYYDDLTVTEQLTIDFMLETKDLNNLTLKLIENEINISAPTVVRAVKKLNFQSYTEFKYELINYRRSKEILKQEDNFSTLINTFENDFKITLSLMKEDELNKSAEIILNSRRVYIIGIGSSANVVSSFNYKLKNIGLWANDYTEEFPIRDIPNVAEMDDCLIVFSLGGKEELINNTVEKCRSLGTNIISITGFSNNKLAQRSHINIMTKQTEPDRDRLKSRLMLSLVSELLFEMILIRRNKISENNK